MSDPKEDEKKGFVWFTLKMITKKKKKKDIKTTDGMQAPATVHQESRQPVTVTSSATAQQPQLEKSKQCSKEKEQRTENPLADGSDKAINTSTKFVMVKAKIRPAHTKMRTRNIMATALQTPEVEKKGGYTEEAAIASLRMGQSNDALRLPVEEVHLDDDEALQQLLCEHRQIDEENNALKNQYREFKCQLRKHLEDFDKETGRLYDLVKSSAVKPCTEQKNVGPKDVLTKPSPVSDPSVPKNPLASPVPAVMPPKIQPQKLQPTVATTQVTYKRTFCMVKGQLVPRYIPEIPLKAEKDNK